MAIGVSDVTIPVQAHAAARTVDASKVYRKGQTEVRVLDPGGFTILRLVALFPGVSGVVTFLSPS